MKIAFPLLNEKELAIDFVHSYYIGIYDDVENKIDLIPLPGLEQRINANIFFNTIFSQDLKSVVCPYYSYLSLRIFKENNIEPLKAISMNLKENIEHSKNKTFETFNVHESLSLNKCAKDCSGCNTSCAGK